MVILASCSTMAPPPKAQRAYLNIAALQLYPLIEKVFEKEGFRTADRNYGRGYIRTEWLEYEGDRHGFVKWKERRRYVALFDIDRISGKHLLILGLDVQEKAPASSEWREKEIDKSSDTEYQRILEALDEAVKNKGGLLV